MPKLVMLPVLVRELVTRKQIPRTPEPDLVMDDPDNVAQYVEAGSITGVMAPTYLFFSANASEVIRPGETVLDLGCGPATQLSQLAQLNPDCNFIGLDLSPPMLQKAKDRITQMGLSNVEFRQGDVSDLVSFEDNSIDAVTSSLALHHLPDQKILTKTFQEVRRVLKPGGGTFIADFGRLKTEKSIRFFVYEDGDTRSELFALDYYNSLHAAFSVDDFRSATHCLTDDARLYTTFLMPMLVALKSPPRRAKDTGLQSRINQVRDSLTAEQERVLKDFKAFFRPGGCRTAYL